MKVLIHIILFVNVLVFSACTIQEPDIFSATPAERLSQALKSDVNVLQSAENGWAMEYFATAGSPGYTMLVKFKANGKAVVSAKNELTKNTLFTDSSFYQMVGDDGPVLTFNTYNKMLHAFSNPVNPDGAGLEGDYEFIVTKSSTDKLELLGKKRGTIILLNKIPLDISWNQYFADLDGMNALLFGNKPQALKVATGNTNYRFLNGSSRVFTILKDGANVNTSITASFIVTRTGIRFHSPQTIENDTIQTFTLNADKSALVSIKNAAIKLVGPDSLVVFFAKNPNRFAFDPTKMSVTFKAAYDLFIQSFTNTYNAENLSLSLQYQPDRNLFYLTVDFKIGKNKILGSLEMNVTTSGKEEVTLVYGKPLDSNGNKFYKIAAFKQLVSFITTSFVITTDAPINPQNIKFVQKSDSASWFVVSSTL